MSDIQSISNGTYVIGQTSATNFIGGQGIKIDSPSAGTVRIGNDETVLWETAGGVTPGNGSALTDYTISLSESISNFEKIRIEMGGRAGATIEMITSTDKLARYITTPDSTGNNNILGLYVSKDTNDQTHINFKCGYGTDYITAYRTGKDWGYFTIFKVIGINRKTNA